MNATTTPKTIKGCPRDRWEEVQAIQHDPFIYIMSNGSKWMGEEEDDLDALFTVLAETPLDPRFEPYGNFITPDPCEGVRNPAWTWGNGEPQWIDGPRMYAVHVVRFQGNFLEVSHGFAIDTNVPEIIDRLTTAIRANQQTEAYLRYKAEIAAAKGRP